MQELPSTIPGYVAISPFGLGAVPPGYVMVSRWIYAVARLVEVPTD